MGELLQRLEQLLVVELNQRCRAVLLAKKAIYLSRIGQFDEAKAITTELRIAFGAGESVQISVWIMLLEGIRLLYEDISPAAHDRVHRAQFLSLAIKDASLIAITSAWKAHLEFERSDFQAMIASVQIAVTNATEEDHDAIARLSMVLADAHFLCGNRKDAQIWFMRSRSHAVSSGDRATTEALLYNRAAFGTAWLRAESCFSRNNSGELALIRLEVASARNFQDITKISALSHLIALCDARLLILESEFERAISALEVVRDCGPFANYNFNQDLIDLELAYCLMKLDRITEALETFGRIRGNDLAGMDVDDRLAVAWLRSEVTIKDGRFGDHALERLKLEAVRDEYIESRQSLRKLLMPFTEA